MQCKQDGLIPIGEAFGNLPGPVKAIREASPPARRPLRRLGQLTVRDPIATLYYGHD